MTAPPTQMKTSYFGNIRNIECPLSISQHPPKWYTGAWNKILAPPWELVDSAQRGMSAEEYSVEFHRIVLDRLCAKTIYDELVSKHTENVVLLCFEKLEKPGDFCHRRLVANWFEVNLCVEVPEWKPRPTVRTTLSF